MKADEYNAFSPRHYVT